MFSFKHPRNSAETILLEPTKYAKNRISSWVTEGLMTDFHPVLIDFDRLFVCEFALTFFFFEVPLCWCSPGCGPRLMNVTFLVWPR